MKKIAFSVLAATLVSLIGFTPASGVEITSQMYLKDPTKEAVYLIGACQTEAELDCLASFGVLDSSSGEEVFVPGRQLSHNPDESRIDSNRNVVRGSNSQWTVDTPNGAKEYFIHAQLEAPRHFWDRSSNSRAGAFRMFISGDEQDLTTKVRIQVRTSWLKPLNLAMYAADANWSQQRITGGNLWTFSGVRTKDSSYNSDWQRKLAQKAPADSDGTSLRFLIDHAGKPGESYYDPTCSDKGFTAEASNATSAGQPRWNPETRSLEFSIAAPHTDTKGNLNRGFFKLWVSRAYMACMWPGSGLEKSPSFTVNVFNEDGTRQTATKVVSFIRGQLFVAAYNFHYSAPTIRVKPSKRATIMCVSKVDQNITKKVKGKKPKCPRGFKKS